MQYSFQKTQINNKTEEWVNMTYSRSLSHCLVPCMNASGPPDKAASISSILPAGIWVVISRFIDRNIPNMAANPTDLKPEELYRWLWHTSAPTTRVNWLDAMLMSQGDSSEVERRAHYFESLCLNSSHGRLEQWARASDFINPSSKQKQS